MTFDPGLPGIVDCREMYRGRSRNASIDGVPTYTRVFLVRTNIVDPNMVYVAAAPGIAWRAPYPDDFNARLMDSSTAQDGDSPFHYKVTYTYRYQDEDAVIPWYRPTQFTMSGSLASAPCFWHYPNSGDNDTKRVIINTAGDPLSGLDRDDPEFNLTIQYNYKPPFPYERAQLYTGSINSDVWWGGAPTTWKCQGFQASRKFESIPGQNPTDQPVKVYYWDLSITLAYKFTGWNLQTWDVGFNELVNGQRKKIMAGSEPVSEPAALSNGRAKTPGQPPDLLSFRIYKSLPFNGVFEHPPTDSPAGYPYNL